MTKELEKIKKRYGEQFAHLCRELFPTILEEEGLLLSILEGKFAPSRKLYQDIWGQRKEDDFKTFIYSQVDVEKEKIGKKIFLTPKELLDQAGYILFDECLSEEDIQSYKKYYAKGEELCTFRGGRLNYCRVWFAVKKNVEEIKRKDFTNPSRQDEYGTSVISIQFTKGDNSTLSIKNRYNHTVNNPDSTFGNNLDNIIEGLTQSFVDTYHIQLLDSAHNKFSLEGYVLGDDEKYHRSNLEIDNVHYCENNIIINNGHVKQWNKDQFLLMDNYLVDQKNNVIDRVGADYEDQANDAFICSLGEIKNVRIEGNDNGKEVIVTPKEGKDIIIKVSDHGTIIGYHNENVSLLDERFLYYNEDLKELYIPNVKVIENQAFKNNRNLTSLNLPEVEEIGGFTFVCNKRIKELYAPKVKEIGDSAFYDNEDLTSLILPRVERIEDNAFGYNKTISELYMPKVRYIGNGVFCNNRLLTNLNLPEVEKISSCVFYYNEIIKELYAPKVKEIGNDVFISNKNLTVLNLPEVENLGERFFYDSKNISEIYLPKVRKIGNSAFNDNEELTILNLPEVEEIKENCFLQNEKIRELFLPKIKIIGHYAFYSNKGLTDLHLPEVAWIGEYCFCENEKVKELYAPKVKGIGGHVMKSNTNLSTVTLPSDADINSSTIIQCLDRQKEQALQNDQELETED